MAFFKEYDMEGLLALNASQTSGSITLSSNNQSASIKFSKESLVLSASFGDGGSDRLDVGVNDLVKSLSISGQKIIDKLNELLKDKLPNGIQSLKPEEVTPEATADHIVKNITALFDGFAKSNPDLQGEDLINKFMEAARKGVEQGYGDAYKTLDDLGAFQFDGVKDGIEQTKKLIEDKLKAFEDNKRQELGLAPKDGTAAEAQSSTTTEILKQAGFGISNSASSGSLNIAA